MSAPWLAELNDAQREAVTYGDGPLLVIAGAGTGKTKTLACRAAYLVQNGTDPERILLLTFTRRAAGEMIDRAKFLADDPAVQNIWGGTFHAVANRLLRQYGRAVGLSADFTVMDASDAADVLNLIRTETGAAKSDRRFPRKQTLIKIYSHVVNAQRPLREVMEEHFPWCADDLDAIATIFERYTERKRASDVVDFDDLLLFWKALCEEEQIRDVICERFDHVLVDEYQDTNSIQAAMLRGLRRGNDNIMVVGDDAQSIYSFRAATVRNILDFPDQFPGTHIVKLEKNYRSTQPILTASNAVMSQAKERFTKDLWSDRASDVKPILVTCTDEDGQSKDVRTHVLDHYEDGVALQRQAVLFRAGHHSAKLEVELAASNIPFHKYGGLKFVDAAHIKDMLAILRILENPYDEISWLRTLLLLRGIGPKSARRIIDELGVRGRQSNGHDGDPGVATPSPLRRMIEEPPLVSPAGREGFAELRLALADCAGTPLPSSRAGKRTLRKSKKRKVASLATQIERIHRFYAPICEESFENAGPRLRDLEQLAEIAAGYKSRTRFITDLTLDPPASTSDLAGAPYLDEDFLVLSTIHSAKGCEWDVVHIIHAADGMIPSDMATADDAGVDEERRLFYVAMTRAKNTLYVYFPLRYYHSRYRRGDGHGYAQLTRFIPTSMRDLFDHRTLRVDDDDAMIDVPGARDRVSASLKNLWRE